MKPEKKAAAPMFPPLMLGGALWSMRPDALPSVVAASRGHLDRVIAGGPLPAQAAIIEAANEAPAGPSVAVIALTGLLTPHGSMLSMLFGGGDRGVQGFRDQLARAVANPEVAAIVLDVDSPGGSVGLVPEAAADVRAAREIKPVYAVANTDCCSGAYYIASQAQELFATPSATVGSIGVYYLHVDWSQMDENDGLVFTYIYAGKHKVDGNPHEPLSDEVRAEWQADADKLYEQFLTDVADGRGVSAAKVKADYGEGRVLLAQDALAAGMVDGVETLQTIIARALTEATSSSGASARRVGRTHHVAAVPRVEAPTDPETPPEEPPAPTEPPPAPEAEPETPPEQPAPEAEADPAPPAEPEAPEPEEPAPVEPDDDGPSAAELRREQYLLTLGSGA